MTRYEKRFFFEAVQRVLGTISPSQKAAVFVSDWIGGCGPGFRMGAGARPSSAACDKRRMASSSKSRRKLVQALSKTRPDQRDRATRSLGRMVELNDTEVAILRLALYSNDRHGIGGLCDLLMDDIQMIDTLPSRYCSAIPQTRCAKLWLATAGVARLV